MNAPAKINKIIEIAAAKCWHLLKRLLNLRSVGQGVFAAVGTTAMLSPSATKCSGTWRVTLTVRGQESCVA